MREVKILPSANDELLTIAEQFALERPNAFARFLEQYEVFLENLRSGLVEYSLSHLEELALLGYRTALVGSYVVLYYVEESAAVIAHIFHQHQDYAELVNHDL